MSLQPSIEISDDDESFEEPCNNTDRIILSDDESPERPDNCMTDDENVVPDDNLKKKRSAVIRNLFPNVLKNDEKKAEQLPVVNESHIKKMIGGVNVQLPVEPYGSQVALMAMLIRAIKKNQNCLLESPTGSGKTLALLCGALAWQFTEKSLVAENKADIFLTHHPELDGMPRAKEYISSPLKNPPFPEDMFSKTTFGERSIYDKPGTSNSSSTIKQDESDTEMEDLGQVKIHKKRGYDTDLGENGNCQTPKKMYNTEKSVESNSNSPQVLRVPTIYYGARTHKQIEQVIKEFKRTWYCGKTTMTILSSREYSCIREFDNKLWKSKNDMCKECVKGGGNQKKTNCKYYDNRDAINHGSLPPAFDLEDLLKFGVEKEACPYYGARGMASTADIVFCPYNYLIDPSIRSNMRINLKDNIVIIDEAHNIEDVCRDAATFEITREKIQAALTELEKIAQYRFAASGIMPNLDTLIRTLKIWDSWFINQMPLVNGQAVNNDEAVFIWKQVNHFIDTLNNHNIGQKQYSTEFLESVEKFCQKLREDPRALLGATQATGTLLESMATALGYLFNNNGKYKDDFRPALTRRVRTNSSALNWRQSQFDKSVVSESLSLRLMCLNPAVVFEGLQAAKTIVLTSGTLTPLISLHSELGTQFENKVSLNHVIPRERVWVGALCVGPDGNPLKCGSKDTSQVSTQDALGDAVLGVCRVTPNGVLCFLPSYSLMYKLIQRWRDTGVWKKLNFLKHVFKEDRVMRDHNDIMENYYKFSASAKGALLFAVYRGKVSEGMDFKDHQARAVITVGVPYPNVGDVFIKSKKEYNDKLSKTKNLLTGSNWLDVQAYRALNQAVGRCVRHRNDWGAVLLVDARFQDANYTQHLSKWVREFLGRNYHSFDSLFNDIESFMKRMTEEDI